MTTRALATLFAAVLAIGAVVNVFLPLKARGQSHHPLHHDFYRHWMQPNGSGMSCCQARVERDGVEVGDCEPTKAEIRGGNWFAWLRRENRWVQIPDAKIIREKNPNVFDAHLCYNHGQVLCFVPPDTGG